MMIFTLPGALSKAAKIHADREAVRCQGSSLSYVALKAKADRLAAFLHARGVRRGDRVGVYVGKGLESTVALYGIMTAGAAYVPLDSFAPPARLAYIIKDCGIGHLISDHGRKRQLTELVSMDVELEAVVGLNSGEGLPWPCFTWEEVEETDPADVPALVGALIEDDLAYILYTSGSTGEPKGIMHTHRSALSFAGWAVNEFSLTSDDRLSNHGPLHFDLSTFDFFAGLLAGATTVVIPETTIKFPVSLSKLMADERITVWYSVPFALLQLLERGALGERDLSALRWILFAGEVFPTKHLRALMRRLPNVRFSNLYGPTETNVCTYYHVPPWNDDDEAEEPIPIGRPCANVEALVVDGENQPVAAGEMGELLIRGPVLTRGYWGRPDLSERALYLRPAFAHCEDRFYRTGDLVEELADGNFKFYGRKDRQIKSRGYRIELDEIEVALLAHEAIREAAAYTGPAQDGSNLVYAAALVEEGLTVTVSGLIAHLRKRLPPYALPVRVDILAAFPRTSTGKIDRRALESRLAHRSSPAEMSDLNHGV